jgi:hypothetical protein
MSDLVWGVALIIPIVVIITYILAQRYRIKMTVEKGLQEAKTQPVTIIEAGSNFTTRMSDFRKNINRLNKALDKRNEMLTKLSKGAKSAGGTEVAEHTGETETGTETDESASG